MRTLCLFLVALAACGGSGADCDYCPGAASTSQIVAGDELVTCMCPSHDNRSMGFLVPDTPRDCGESQQQWHAYVQNDCAPP